MKQLLVMFAVLFSSSFATADLAPMDITNPAVLGSWKTARAVFTGNGMSVFIGMTFKADSTADMSSICTFPGKSLEATVNVPVEVNATEIRVTGAGKAEVVDGGYTCNVDVDSSTEPATYVINGNRLRLTFQGNSLDFVRR